MGGQSSKEVKGPAWYKTYSLPIPKKTGEVIVTDEAPQHLCVNFIVLESERDKLLTAISQYPAYHGYREYDCDYVGEKSCRRVPIINTWRYEEQLDRRQATGFVEIEGDTYKEDEILVTDERPTEIVADFVILEHEMDDVVGDLCDHPAYNYHQKYWYTDLDSLSRKVKIISPREYEAMQKQKNADKPTTE